MIEVSILDLSGRKNSKKIDYQVKCRSSAKCGLSTGILPFQHDKGTAVSTGQEKANEIVAPAVGLKHFTWFIIQG